MELLEQKHCVPCEGGTLPATSEEIQNFLLQLKTEWHVSDQKKLVKVYTFKDFKEALLFVNKIGEVAESEGHHPDLELSWGKVVVTLSTHAINGLSINDFVIARRVEILYTEHSK